MKAKVKKLEWNVLIFDWNKKKVVDYNIFSYGFNEILNKKIKANEMPDMEALKGLIKRWCKHRYHAKSEFEIKVGDLCVRNINDLEKIDAFRQVEMNLDRIAEYVNKELEVFK